MSDFNLFDKIISENNVYSAYEQCLRGKCKYKRDAIRFDKDQTYNLNKLINSLKKKTYQPDSYKKFKVYEPKERIIYASVFRDKIVQVMVNNVIKELYSKKFIYDSYACLDNKGTHKAADRIQEFVNKARLNYGKDATVIKIDINKYFYSINRKILKKLLRKHIKCLDTLWLLDLIIDNSPEEKGLPLGNITSHLLANLYLNLLDQYCKRWLSIKYYVRYMDDIVLIINGKERARYVLDDIIQFLFDNLDLQVNPKKTKLFLLIVGDQFKTHTINSVGYKIYATHKLLRNNSKKKIKLRVRKLPKLINDEKISKEKAEQILNSWYGHATHCNSLNFIFSLIRKYNFIILTGYGLKIRKTLCRLPSA